MLMMLRLFMGGMGVNEMRLSAAFIGLAVTCSAQAQEHLLVSIDEVSLGSWTITAELLNPDPNKEIVAVVSQFFIYLEGSGFDDFTYNNQFDSDFAGPSRVIVQDGSIEFWGHQWLPPINNVDGPDSSNPLWAASFTADVVDSFEFIGDINGAYSASPFPEVFYYYRQDGAPADFGYTIDINPIPGPGGTVLITGASLMGLQRRRR